MDFTKRIAIALIMASVLFSGCTSNKAMKRMLTAYPASLNYIIEERPQAIKSNQQVYVEADTSFLMMPATADRIQGQFLPFIFYTRLKQAHLYTVDTSSVSENLPEFLKTAFEREAHRSYKFKITENRDSADYILNLKIEQLSGQGVFHSLTEWYAIPYGVITSYKVTLDNVKASCTLSYSLKDAVGNVMSSGTHQNSYIPDNKNQLIEAPAGYHYRIANGLVVNGLSNAFRGNFKAIIKELNDLNITSTTTRTFDP